MVRGNSAGAVEVGSGGHGGELALGWSNLGQGAAAAQHDPVVGVGVVLLASTAADRHRRRHGEQCGDAS